MPEAKMLSRNKVAGVSGLLVAGMFVVAWSEMQHGVPLSEVHLITSAPVMIASSTTVHTGAGYHFQSAIIDADYQGPADSRPLPRDGLTHPRNWIPRVM
jgi:hypothetical protein